MRTQYQEEDEVAGESLYILLLIELSISIIFSKVASLPGLSPKLYMGEQFNIMVSSFTNLAPKALSFTPFYFLLHILFKILVVLGYILEHSVSKSDAASNA